MTYMHVLTLHDSVLVLGLGLGEVAAVLVGASVLVREGLPFKLPFIFARFITFYSRYILGFLLIFLVKRVQ